MSGRPEPACREFTRHALMHKLTLNGVARQFDEGCQAHFSEMRGR